MHTTLEAHGCCIHSKYFMILKLMCYSEKYSMVLVCDCVVCLKLYISQVFIHRV